MFWIQLNDDKATAKWDILTFEVSRVDDRFAAKIISPLNHLIGFTDTMEKGQEACHLCVVKYNQLIVKQ